MNAPLPSRAPAPDPAEPATHGESPPRLDATFALPLLRHLPTLGHTTTVILHGGCVFEFKGTFPAGAVAEGFYNLDGPVPGFHGHLRLDAIAAVRFQDRPHRGRASYAFVFEDDRQQSLFKVFLGRDASGAVIETQLDFFQRLRAQRSLPLARETPQ